MKKYKIELKNREHIICLVDAFSNKEARAKFNKSITVKEI